MFNIYAYKEASKPTQLSFQTTHMNYLQNFNSTSINDKFLTSALFHEFRNIFFSHIKIHTIFFVLIYIKS